ncbi:hypothetical protein [Pararhodobacter aggregans]|uniref:hypothetical protein n=1 Tax=Pararhodobacter aggregans TaxID=404875 RepID=UPI003A933033
MADPSNDRDPTEGEIRAAFLVLYRAADAGLLSSAVYADLARLRIAYTLAFPPPAAPCEPQF